MKMKSKDWFLICFALILTIALDQITKQLASDLTQIKLYGYFGLALVHNPGVMLGLFADVPAILRVVSLSTGGAFLIFCFMVIQYLLPIKSMILRVGLAVLLGGILGNVIDRILYGYVIDFMFLGTIKSPITGVFNVADALQWVAYAMIVYALVKDSEILWPANNRRGRLWVKPRFQMKYCMILVFAGFAFSLISGVYSYTFLRVILTTPQRNAIATSHVLSSFSITFVIISIAFAICMFIVGLRLSHKTAGPLYAFEKYLKDLSTGTKREFKLRVGDEFQELEEISSHIMSELNKIRAQTPKEESEVTEPTG